MACNISCTIHMNPSCNKERKSIKLKRVPFNIPSKREMHKSEKLRNNPNSFTHIVMHIMRGISMTDAHSPQRFISSMVPSSTGVAINSLKHPETVQM